MATFNSLVKFNENEQEISVSIRHHATLLEDVINLIEPCRERSLAMTKLEECVMWANKGIAQNHIKMEV